MPQLFCRRCHGLGVRRRPQHTRAGHCFPTHEGPEGHTEVLVQGRHKPLRVTVVLATSLQTSTRTLTQGRTLQEGSQSKEVRDGQATGTWPGVQGDRSTGQGPLRSSVLLGPREPPEEPAKTAVAPGELRAAALKGHAPGRRTRCLLAGSGQARPHTALAPSPRTRCQSPNRPQMTPQGPRPTGQQQPRACATDTRPFSVGLSASYGVRFLSRSRLRCGTSCSPGLLLRMQTDMRPQE